MRSSMRNNQITYSRAAHIAHSGRVDRAECENRPRSASSVSRSGRSQGRRRARPPFLLVVGLALAIFLCTQGSGYPSGTSDADDYGTPRSVAFAVEDTTLQTESTSPQAFYQTFGTDSQEIAATFSLLPASSSVTAFSLLDNGTELDLSEEQRENIESALNDLNASAAFTIVDAQSGKGIQYNADEHLYAASSAKAWFSLFLAQLADEGTISLEDPVSCWATDYPVSQSRWDGTYCVGSLIENTLLYSDNAAYSALRNAYEEMGYAQWLTDLGIDPVVIADTSWYPFLSPVASAQMWTNIYVYLNSNAKDAAWLKQLLENTQVSFLRDSLVDENVSADGDATSAGGEETQAEDSVQRSVSSSSASALMTVYNKAGWDSASEYAGYQSYLNAMCDSGVIEAGGHTYIVSVLANIEEGDANAVKLERLMSALYEAAQTL